MGVVFGDLDGAAAILPSRTPDRPTTWRILARYEGNAVVSGATANRSRTVFGLGNVFDLRRDLEYAWRDAASAARALWGAMPAVSHDFGESLAAAQRAGFAPSGRLVVWVKREESGRPTLAGP